MSVVAANEGVNTAEAVCRNPWYSPVTLTAVGLLALYAALFLFGLPGGLRIGNVVLIAPDEINGLFPEWFHPDWTTDDAVQQLYPLHRIYHPELFQNDLITLMMRAYLAPLHYGVSYLVTLVTADPVMTGHWVMLLQLVPSIVFLFLAVRAGAGEVPALFGIAWFLHTRHVIQRLTGGLPRGWAAPLFFAYLYFLMRGKHRAVLATIAVGCWLQPVAAFLIAGSYGLFLVWRFCLPGTRAITRRPLIECLLAAPVFALITLPVVQMPPEIGTMVSYQDALSIPEFQNPTGRFPFVPLSPIWDEVRLYGFHAFEIRYVNPGDFWRASLPWFVGALLVGLAVVGVVRRRVVFPAEVVTFGIGAAGVYLLSRIFAFHLYVPDRHLRFPFAVFFIVLLCIGVWRALHSDPVWRATAWRACRGAVAGLCGVALLLYCNSGFGLKGSANFNFTANKYGSYPAWARKFSPKEALFVGHPTFMDSLQLFGMRKAFVTTETAHPFYTKYGTEMRRRLEIAFRAHYASSWQELLQICEPEGITHVVFARKKFYPEALAVESYKEPQRALVQQLVSRPADRCAFKRLPRAVDIDTFPPLVYRDEEASVVDLRALRTYINAHPEIGELQSQSPSASSEEYAK